MTKYKRAGRGENLKNAPVSALSIWVDGVYRQKIWLEGSANHFILDMVSVRYLVRHLGRSFV